MRSNSWLRHFQGWSEVNRWLVREGHALDSAGQHTINDDVKSLIEEGNEATGKKGSLPNFFS